MSVCDKHTSGVYYKSFMIVIYDHNDSQLYGSTIKLQGMLLALACVINYASR